MKNGAAKPIALSISGSSNQDLMNTINAPMRPPTTMPPAAASANVPRPDCHVAAVPIAAASATL